MNRELYKIDDIIEKLKHENFSFYLVSTDKYDLTTNPKSRNSKKSRSDWADATVKELYRLERSQIVKKCPRRNSTGEYNFAYIKFAKNEDGIFGVVHGKSSFHCMYPSDVWFYDFDDGEKEELVKFFKKKRMEWYTKAIIIIKNQNDLDSKEAYKNEGKLKEWFKTFD